MKKLMVGKKRENTLLNGLDDSSREKWLGSINILPQLLRPIDLKGEADQISTGYGSTTSLLEDGKGLDQT